MASLFRWKVVEVLIEGPEVGFKHNLTMFKIQI